MPFADPELLQNLEASADRVFRFCLHLTGGRRADAEDLAQETLIAGFRALPGFLRQAQLSTYLYKIAVHAWRRRAVQPARHNLPLEERDVCTTDPIEQHLQQLRVAQALDSLPEPLREAFLLVKVQQFTHREAAALLEVPQGTIQSRVHEAIQRLRVLLAEEREK